VREPVSIDLSPTDTPARDLPNAMWIDVLKVLKLHGLEPQPLDVAMACKQLIDVTPADKGGRA
jgi:hypothetical protein